MARPMKRGLDYFPLENDFFCDDKIRLVRARHGIKGEYIALRLLSKIYKENGYYYRWGEDEAELFAMDLADGVTCDQVRQVVDDLMKREFFDRAMYDAQGILTSNGIQRRFDHICTLSKLKREPIEAKYDVRRVSSEEMDIDSELIPNYSEEMGKNPEEIAETSESIPKFSEESTQRKGKKIESKVYKSTAEERKRCVHLLTLENDNWISNTCKAYETQPYGLKLFCETWLEQAQSKMMFEQYEAMQIIRFMLEDMGKQKAKHAEAVRKEPHMRKYTPKEQPEIEMPENDRYD